jgi:hypothetical protein
MTPLVVKIMTALVVSLSNATRGEPFEPRAHGWPFDRLKACE